MQAFEGSEQDKSYAEWYLMISVYIFWYVLACVSG